MSDYLRNFLQFPVSDWHHLLLHARFAWAIPLALVVVSLLLLRPWFLRVRNERRVRASIRRLGKSSLRDVSLDNGMDGFAFIDCLVLNSEEILIVTLMRHRGIIFGGEKVDNWARVVGRRTVKFPNPLVASEDRLLAVKYHVPDVKVRGVVLFEEGCTFPKGKPEGVIVPQEIVTEPRQWEEAAVPEPLAAAWEKLSELSRRAESLYGHDLSLLRGDYSRLRETAAVSLLVLAVLWGAWQLLNSSNVL